MFLGSGLNALFLAENLPIVIPSFRVPICRLPTRLLHNLLHQRRGLDRERAAAGLPYQTLISSLLHKYVRPAQGSLTSAVHRFFTPGPPAPGTAKRASAAERPDVAPLRISSATSRLSTNDARVRRNARGE